MNWLRAQWREFKRGFVGVLEAKAGMSWRQAVEVLRHSVLPALWERFVGVVVFLGLFAVGGLVLWVAWHVLLFARKVALLPILLICAGCGVDRAGLQSDPCATCDGGGVNQMDAKTVVLCIGMAACSSAKSSSPDGGVAGEPATVDGAKAPGRGAGSTDDAGLSLGPDAGPDVGLETGAEANAPGAGLPDVGAEIGTSTPDAGLPDVGVIADVKAAPDVRTSGCQLDAGGYGDLSLGTLTRCTETIPSGGRCLRAMTDAGNLIGPCLRIISSETYAIVLDCRQCAAVQP